MKENLAGQVFLYNENCFKTMEKMADKGFKVDLVMTSPPYNTARTSKTQKSLDTYNNRYDIHLDNMTDEEYCRWSEDLFSMFDKILQKDGVILYNISYGSENPFVYWKFIGMIANNDTWMIADRIIWKKNAALPNNVGNKLTRIVEDVLVIVRKSEYKTFRTNKKVKSVREDTGQKYYDNVYNFIEAKNNDGPCKLNKATYSSDLCLSLFNIYAKPDYVIYDPFMGTGTTAIACLRYNDGNNQIVCIGSELSAAQVEYSKDRILESFPSVKVKTKAADNADADNTENK